MNLNIADRTC